MIAESLRRSLLRWDVAFHAGSEIDIHDTRRRKQKHATKARETDLYFCIRMARQRRISFVFHHFISHSLCLFSFDIIRPPMTSLVHFLLIINKKRGERARGRRLRGEERRDCVHIWLFCYKKTMDDTTIASSMLIALFFAPPFSLFPPCLVVSFSFICSFRQLSVNCVRSLFFPLVVT